VTVVGREPIRGPAHAHAPDLTIVMPVYNEGSAIEPVLRRVVDEVATPHELLVVYDSEDDTTVPVIRRLETSLPTVRGELNTRGRGVLNALRHGMGRARGTYVVVMMGDGSDDPGEVDRMVARAEAGADVVAASRYMRGGRQIGGPRVKRLLSRTAGLSLHWLAGVPIHDATSNYRLYRRSFLVATPIESRAGFELALELTVKAVLAGREVGEVPTTWRDRTTGSSNFHLRAWLPEYLRWYATALRGRFMRRRLRRPRGRRGSTA
jgi:dolichol-phosphate mannosyltransferase